MLYETAEAWRAAPQKRVLVFGMSGLGKTHVSQMLRDSGGWFHYSIDYRIGTRYMGEYIADNAKAEAMKVPFLRELLLTDSIYIGSNLTFHNLTPVAAYLGKPGDPARGGLPMQEYRRRQDQFRTAEIHALLDTGYFIDRAQRLYGYPQFHLRHRRVDLRMGRLPTIPAIRSCATSRATRCWSGSRAMPPIPRN